MEAYIYQADIYCKECGEKLKLALDSPENPDDETTFDSDEYPKGPFCDGGGEADSPQHCADCKVPLENPLTADGEEYAKENKL